MRILFQWALLLLSAIPLPAQTEPDSSYLDISKIETVDALDQSALYTSFERNKLPDQDIANLKYSQKLPSAYSQKLPVRVVESNIYLRFSLYNGSDTANQVYFFPGLYCQDIRLFKASTENIHGTLTEVKNLPEETGSISGYVLITLRPKESAVFFAKTAFVLTTQNTLTPRIIRKGFISYFRNNLLSHKITLNIFNYVTAGILFMMIIYSTSVFFQDYNVEFLYYSAYALCMGLLLFLKSYLLGTTSQFNYYFEGCFDFLLWMTGYFFYLLFIRKFLSTRRDHPLLNKMLAVSSWVILTSFVLFTTIYLSSNNLGFINFVENTTEEYLLMMSILFILYGFWKKNPLMNYLVAGQFALTLMSILSFLLIITPLRFSITEDSLFNDPLLYYQIGLVLELVFFMSALSYKNKRSLTERFKERERLKLDNERKEFEKQVAILEAKQQERNRISADMHDELGSGVTAIRLMSEIVKSKMKENTLPEIEKISHSANELLGKMNTIIWTMVSSNDTIESLIAYIRAYAVEFFENTPIECQFKLPDYIPPMELSGEKRRNLFLSVKEALNNVLKHSQASRVMINIDVRDKLQIEIADNGVGIDMDHIRKFGNGLQNMRRRIA
ncbi:MAG: 7TM diverse intracellular signaling domain-containing protein, partial [Chitinophagales bacterium]